MNNGMFGAGGLGTLQDLLGGLSLAQVQRMRQGRTPGGEHGDFVGMTPQRLMLLASLMKPGLHAGNSPAMFTLQHQRGDGLFHGSPGFAARPGMRMGQQGNGPVQAIGGPIPYQGGVNPAGNPSNGLPFRMVNAPGGVQRQMPGHPQPVPGRIRRLAGMKPPFGYPVR